MKERFLENLTRLGVKKGDRVTLAFSGGLDSVVLLALLKEQELMLQAVHIHHGIRGDGADRDARFCESLCQSWQVPFKLLKGDAPAYAKERGMSLEEGAREMRYSLLAPFEEKGFLATAHHGDDNAETFFINLYRGSGSAGLIGIPERRGNLIRPLLPFSKEELRAYAKAEGLSYCEDETNEDESYLRNFLRREILPRLDSREEGNFRKGLAASMKHLKEEHQALQKWADSIQTDRQEDLAALPAAVLKRVLDRMNGEALLRVHFDQICRLLSKEQGCGRVQIGEERYFALEYGHCRFIGQEEAVELSIRPNQPVCYGGREFSLCTWEINTPFTHFSIDCDKIGEDLVLRHRREGDLFQPVGGERSTSRLQKRLKNDRMGRSRRDSLWILAERSGRILWVEHYGADRSAACDGSTKRAFCIEIKEEGK